MLDHTDPIRIFVAMPGDLGPHSRYRSAESVKVNFLDRIAESLEQELRRPVKLVIEKDKLETGPIHSSMFAEAVNADVYIADLTNANPNVYLELGVRWTLSDGLTIPIYQNRDDLRFNVASSRAFMYTPDNISSMIREIVTVVKNFLAAPQVDSPVRQTSEIVAIKKSELEQLRADIRRLQDARGGELFRAAIAASNSEDKIALLERAVQVNPAFSAALLELGVAYRAVSDYAKSEITLLAARRLEPGNAVIHRELGVTYSKSHRVTEAITSLKEAVALSPGDGEGWSTLGGALRRFGLKDAPVSYDIRALSEARACYGEAEKLDRFDLYAALNVCRLDLVLSGSDPQRYVKAVSGFKALLPLCQFEAEQSSAEPSRYRWRLADWAEALLFSGRYAEAKSTFEAAIKSVPAAERGDYSRSVTEPLVSYLALQTIPDDLKAQIREVLALFPKSN